MATRKSPRKLTFEELFAYAVKCLGARAYSAGDLGAKLRLRAANPADVKKTLDRLAELGYLNDRRFAESFASARIENEGFGRLRVLSDLRARRVDGNLAEQAVEQALDGRSEADLIDAYIARRMPSMDEKKLAAGGRIEDEKKLAAAYRRLRRAGFTPGAILPALKRRAARPEMLEEPPEEEPIED